MQMFNVVAPWQASKDVSITWHLEHSNLKIRHYAGKVKKFMEYNLFFLVVREGTGVHPKHRECIRIVEAPEPKTKERNKSQAKTRPDHQHNQRHWFPP